MIGALSVPIGLSSVSSNPSGIITSPFYGYKGSYQTADSLKPMHAYWVKVRSNGRLVMAAPSGGNAVQSKVGSRQADNLGKFSTLTIRDAAGSEQELLFGVRNGLDLERYELPPLPPEGVFDVRYSTGR